MSNRQPQTIDEIFERVFNDFEDFWSEEAKAALSAMVVEIIGGDVKYVEVFRDITDDADYRYLVKRPMAEKHKNELRVEQRQRAIERGFSI